MTFIIILIALVMERFFHWHHTRHWYWFMSYERWLSEYSVRLPDGLRLAISLIPPLVVVALVSYLLSGLFYGLFELVFGVFVILYCLGPGNLWVEVYQCIDDLHREDTPLVLEHTKKYFGLKAIPSSQAFHQAFLKTIFVAANERIFAVIFWFVLLGPVGAVLYRLITLFSAREELGLTEIALKVKQVMDWLPVRVFTFIFALGGHFTEVFACWKKNLNKDLTYNEKLVADCGFAALDVMQENKIPEKGAAEKEAMELLDRVFVMFLVILAIIVTIL